MKKCIPFDNRRIWKVENRVDCNLGFGNVDPNQEKLLFLLPCFLCYYLFLLWIFLLDVEFSFALFKLLKMFEQNKESGAVFIGMELAWVERQLQPDLGFQLFTGFENLGRLVQRVYAELAAALKTRVCRVVTGWFIYFVIRMVYI